MALFKLSPAAYVRLRETAQSSPKARAVRRAPALRWLHKGNRVTTIAQRLGVSRRTVRRWIKRYRACADVSGHERIREGRHSGRPPSNGSGRRKSLRKFGRVTREATDSAR